MSSEKHYDWMNEWFFIPVHTDLCEYTGKITWNVIPITKFTLVLHSESKESPITVLKILPYSLIVNTFFNEYIFSSKMPVFHILTNVSFKLSNDLLLQNLKK